MISDDELDEMQARANAATPGPWRARACGEIVAGRHIVATSDGGGGSVWVEWWNEADKRFAAHARTDVPRLIAEIRRLQSELMADEILDDTLNGPSSIEVMARETAEARRAEILQSIPDEAAFRQQGENFQLNSEDLAKYVQLCNLEWLLEYGEES